MADQPQDKPVEPGATGSDKPAPADAPARAGVSVVLDVTRDKLEAGVTFHHVPQGPAFSAEMLRLNLEQQGIKFGLRKEILELTEDKLEYDKRMVIAEGVKPAEGKGGEITYVHPVTKPAKVTDGEKIADILPPEPGKHGNDVYGEIVPCREAKSARIPALENVELVDDKKLVARATGYLKMSETGLKVEPFFALEDDSDEYNIYATVVRPRETKDFTVDDLTAFLKNKGIVYGIQETEIINIFSQSHFFEPTQVARGDRPVDGKNGELKFFFETEIKPQMDAKGNVDYHQLNLIQNVVKGDRLVEVIAPQDGTPGKTVYGKEIPPAKGKTATLPSYKNASPDPHNPDVIVADIDGCVRMKGKTVEVEPIFAVKDDVNFSTGNIDFRGSVFVNKNVLSGFKIKAEGDVEVNGVVEDAEIVAGGNVLVKMGFIGRDQGEIRADGEVHLLFCDNETVISGGDIFIGDYAMNSRISTGGRLHATEKSGLLVGGEIFAVRGVEARNIGNRNYVPTHVIAGEDKRQKETLLALKKNQADLETKIGLMNDALRKCAYMKLMRRSLTPQQQMQVAVLTKLKAEKEQDCKEFQSQITAILNRPRDVENAVVIAIDTLYPGVTVNIYEHSASLSEPMKGLYYKYSEKELVQLPLDDEAAPAAQPPPEAPEKK